jgi:diaminopimelate decarboxylase
MLEKEITHNLYMLMMLFMIMHAHSHVKSYLIIIGNLLRCIRMYLDQICKTENTLLPYCDEGDWLEWENMGAYTHTASFIFNGYAHYPEKFYCYISI